jgi:hypothetical protein
MQKHMLKLGIMLTVALGFLLLQLNADAAIIVSLAGDKDSFGTGLPLGDPVIPTNMVHDPEDGDFDQRRTSLTTWRHEYTMPEGHVVVGATLTVVSIDIEDGGACDGRGAAACDDKLFLNGVEVLGAFDDTFTPDLSSNGFIPPNTTVFTLGPAFFPLLNDGIVDIVVDPRGGSTTDHIWLDYAELKIETASEDGDILSPAILWLGLKNSDDQGTSFDLKTEVSINDTLISDGVTRCIIGVTRNPSRAKDIEVLFSPTADNVLDAGDILSLKILTRIGTNSDDSKCPGHKNAVGLRLYYDGVNRPSRFGAEIAPHPLADLFLHSVGTKFLDGEPPTATTATFQDSPSLNFSGGNPW